MGHARLKGSTRSLRCSLLASAALIVAPAIAQTTDDDAERRLDTITVTSAAEFFRPTEATTAAKIPLEIVETPQAITVLTGDILELTGARDLEDASGLVPGIVSKGTYGGFDNRFSARGFDISIAEGVLINGVQVASNVDRDFLGVERIEYLRGPTSIVLGTLNFGGAINIITKRPTEALSGSFSAEAGSFDTYRVEGEVSGALPGSNGAVRAYFAAAYEDRGSFRDAQELTKIPIRAAVDVDFSEQTTLTVDLSYEDGEGVPISTFSRDYNGATGFIPDYVPVEWNACSFVDDCATEYENTELTTTLRHDFSDSQYIRGTFGYATTDRRHRFISFLGLGGPTGFGFTSNQGPYGFWYTYDDSDDFETYFTEFAYGGEFEAFGQSHDFLFLVENRRREYTEDYRLNDPDLFFALYANVLDPTTNFGSGDTPIEVLPTFSWDNTTRIEENLSATAQLVLRPTDKLQFLLGVRYEEEDFTETGINNGGSSGPFGSSYDVDLSNGVDDTVFRAGAVYEVVSDVFAYASYSEGFFPTDVNDDAGQPVPSEEGTQYEIGVKGEFFGGLLGAGASAFLIERDNVPSTVGDGVLSSPSSRSQDHMGVELEVLGEVFEGLDVIATYSYLDTEITKSLDDPDILGNEIPNAPNHLASFFAQYQLPFDYGGAINGVSVGGGARYVGETWDSESNVFKLPSYTLLEANLSVDI